MTKGKQRLILVVWLGTIPFFYMGSVFLREASFSWVWRIPVTIVWFWLVASLSRQASCLLSHEVMACHNHAGTWARSRVCWLIDALTLGHRGHVWVAPYVIKIRPTKTLWKMFIAWPILYEGTVVVRGEEHEVIGQRPDLPMPTRMNAVCRRCGCLWLVHKEMPLIERIALLEHVGSEDVDRLMFAGEGKNPSADC